MARELSDEITIGHDINIRAALNLNKDKERQRVERENPLDYLTPLKGDWVPFYKFRVGDYRLIIDVENLTLTLVFICVGHRKNVYD